MNNIASDAGMNDTMPLVVGNPSVEEHLQDKMFKFDDARTHLKRIIDDWHTEIEDTEVRRKERKVEIDVEGLRQKGDLQEDETIVPIRIIDQNITREQPPYINYLKNSRRISIFDCVSDPEQNTDLLEQAFTKVSTYTSWETPHFKCLDGSQAHGWDAVEVTYDQSKPGNYSIEHIGHDRLLFPRSAIDLQKCPRIIRCYDVTLTQLMKWIGAYGFSKEQVSNIKKARQETSKENETIRIYKLFFKKDDVVYVAWFSMENGCNDWLCNPSQFYCGIDEQVTVVNPLTPLAPQTVWQPKPVDLYPIFILPYREMEEQKIVDHKGRAFLDAYKQEALTALWSAFVNGMTRASNVYASPDQEDGTGSSLKELNDVKLSPGRILSRPMKFWAPPYPAPIVLTALQHAENENAQETNQVNFASMNREDSRKTAKEISSSEQQQNLLNSVQLTLFSTFIRQVYSFAWLIVQSQALQNKIQFLMVKQESMNQMGQPTTSWTNDIATISKVYSIRAAGDVDVIQREELIARMQQDFPLVMQTSLKDQFLMDYIKLKYPDRQEQYMRVLSNSGQMQQLTAMVQRLNTIVNGLLQDHPDALQNLDQQSRASLAQTMQEAEQLAPTAQQ